MDLAHEIIIEIHYVEVILMTQTTVEKTRSVVLLGAAVAGAVTSGC